MGAMLNLKNINRETNKQNTKSASSSWRKPYPRQISDRVLLPSGDGKEIGFEESQDHERETSVVEVV